MNTKTCATPSNNLKEDRKENNAKNDSPPGSLVENSKRSIVDENEENSDNIGKNSVEFDSRRSDKCDNKITNSKSKLPGKRE